MNHHRHIIFIFALFSLLLSACGKNPTFNLNHYKIDNVTPVQGHATKGSTVIFRPQNKEYDTEKASADADGTIIENALLPGEYTVYAKLNGKTSTAKKLIVTSYTETKTQSESIAKESSKQISESKAVDSYSESIAKEMSSTPAQSKESASYNSTKPSYNSRYKKVSLTKFTENTSAYEGKDIQISGTVAYIQKNPDNSTMYYTVIVPQDEYDSTGYSTGHGTVTEIDVDSMKDNNIHEGDSITVCGEGLQDTVSLNGKTLNSDIIVDSVSVH